MIESEKLIEKKLTLEVKNVGGMSIKLIPLHLIGLPDRLLLFPGAKVIFVETKTTGDKPRLIQIKVMDKIRALGFDVRVIDSTAGILKLINDVTKK